MKKILTVLGARPQFIKASVVSHAMARTPGLTEVLVHTGQHFDANMSEVFFAELGMCRVPDDCIDPRRRALFIGRETMRELIEELRRQKS